ncbi:MAG: ExbD/TolR family protein [Pseudomonadota bacterium]
MNFRRGGRDEISLDLTPLIDVVFLLLLFFMLTTTFVHAQRLKVDLPQAGQSEASEEKDPWVIEIDARGQYAINGDAVSAAMLAERLRAIPESHAETRVLIRADGQASHQSVVHALDAARAAGLVHIGLATEQPPRP